MLAPVYVIISILLFLVMIAALIDIITRDESQVRHLPRFAWILLVVLLPLIGCVIWFLVGHEWTRPPEPVTFGDPRRQDAAVERRRDLSNTEIELAALEAEIAAAEREERIRRLQAELDVKRDPRQPGGPGDPVH